MGQRNAIVMFLWGGGAIVPVAVLFVVAGQLGRAALPVALCLSFFGLTCLIVAKWPRLSKGELISFGPRLLSPAGRKFYWAGLALVACGLVLALGALPLR